MTRAASRADTVRDVPTERSRLEWEDGPTAPDGSQLDDHDPPTTEVYVLWFDEILDARAPSPLAPSS